MTIDFESLLRRYMAHVNNTEGTPFAAQAGPGFTDEEVGYLEQTAEEIYKAERERSKRIQGSGPPPTLESYLSSVVEYRGPFIDALDTESSAFAAFMAKQKPKG